MVASAKPGPNKYGYKLIMPEDHGAAFYNCTTNFLCQTPADPRIRKGGGIRQDFGNRRGHGDGVVPSLFYGSLKISQISGVVLYSSYLVKIIFFQGKVSKASCCFSFFVCQIKNSKTEAN
jgi:hypothetical protein